MSKVAVRVGERDYGFTWTQLSGDTALGFVT
jgi:hypothetical protein